MKNVQIRGDEARGREKGTDPRASRPTTGSANPLPRSPDLQVGQPTREPILAQEARSADPATSPILDLHARKHKRHQSQPLAGESNESKRRNTINPWIKDVTNPRERPCNESGANTWSPDLPQGRPTFPRKHLPRGSTAVTANHHQEARSGR